MKKKLMAVAALALILTVGTALADGKLNGFTDRLKNAAQKAMTETETVDVRVDAGETTMADGLNIGPSVRMDDPFFACVRTSAFLHETDYSREANVLVELKNVSGRTLYPKNASITAYNAGGEVIEEETYSYTAPAMIEDGSSLYIWDWFYGFDVPVAEISYFEVKIETETSSYSTYKKINGEGTIVDGKVYALVENATDSEIYDIEATMIASNEKGNLLDIAEVTTSGYVGILPGSTMVLRANASDYEHNEKLNEAKVEVIAQYRTD